MITALIACVPLAAFSGAMGCVVLWRSMAYYGDAMAHAAMLGVALSWLLPSVPAMLCVFAVIAALSVLMERFHHRRILSPNTILAILAYSALSVGILLVLLQGGGAVDVHRYLLGDMLTLENSEAHSTAAFSLLGIAVLLRCHRWLALLCVDHALASVAGIRVKTLSLLTTFLLAAFIAFAVPLVGILLVTALLIIPAATARYLARTPLQMIIVAGMIAIVGLSGGVAAAFALDTPPAPTITALLACLFVFSSVFFKAR